MSSDGEGPARASASPARRGHSGGSDQSQSPPAPGAMDGNNSDNDAGILGSDTGKANDDDEDLFGSESEAGDDKYARLRFSHCLGLRLYSSLIFFTGPLENLTTRNSTPETMWTGTTGRVIPWIMSKGTNPNMERH